MYLTNIRLENTGPINFLRLALPQQGDLAPKPVVLVGPNGSGKSIFLSHVVSAMLNAHSSAYEDSDVEKGKVYKLRGGTYIRRGQNYSLSCLEFSDELFEEEINLNSEKSQYEQTFDTIPIFKRWQQVPASDNSFLSNEFANKKTVVEKALIGPHLYFPPNRFEEPAWLNEQNLLNKAEYFTASRIQGYSSRPVIQYSPMRDNQNWLLDIIYDSQAIERKLTLQPAVPGVGNNLYALNQGGPATNILRRVESFLRILLGAEGQIQWGVGGRSQRNISVADGNGLLTENLFSLSTGQALLLDFFLAILRHADISGQQVSNLSDVRGLVVVDEIDLHLHTKLQFELLPTLIQLFPGVQFILSSHSPLFLLGMEKLMGEDGVRIVELPTGDEISAERFCEFEAAYQHLSDTRKFETDLNKKLSDATQPLLIVEGTTDIDYIKKAAEHLGKTEFLEQFEFVDGDGFKGLNQIWKNLFHERWSNVTQTVVLLYDCDVNPKNNEVGKAFQRTIPIQESIVTKGIENLFSTATLQKASEDKSAFIDHTPARTLRVRGDDVPEPELWAVNKDEKRNLCDWLCENGDAADFSRFSVVFDILEECYPQSDD